MIFFFKKIKKKNNLVSSGHLSAPNGERDVRIFEKKEIKEKNKKCDIVVTIGGKQKQNVCSVYLFGHQVTKKKYKNFNEHNNLNYKFTPIFFFIYI